jgi:16S rRNA (cytosine1402-N4)-methyltransferase
MEKIHTTVLLKEAVEALNINPNGVYVDATLGLGGHSKEILKRLNNKGKLIGVEVDKQIYEHTKNLFKHSQNVSLYNCNFNNVDKFLLSRGIRKIDGAIFDLGTNLFQIKGSGRGFSFLTNEGLDMRLDTSQDVTAEKIVNSYPRERLEEVLKRVDERFYRPIAKKIVESRRVNRIETTSQLVEIVKSVKYKRGKTNPATLTFMALRIEVNKELEVLEEAIEKFIKLLQREGRLVVISFHSGEDRIVKRILREQKTAGILKIINKKVITASRAEEVANPLSRSAKMRVVEKL